MRRALAALGALLLHAAVVVWLTWPLAAEITTHLPDTWTNCRIDPLLLAWALAHQSRALTTAPATFPHGNIFHPTWHALYYGEAGFGAVPFFMGPFLLTGNPALALNLTFLVGVALTAWSLHLVVVRWTGSQLGGALAGFAYLTTPWVLWAWIPSAPNYAVLLYLPWIIRAAAAPVPGLGLFVLVVLQGLTSIYVAAATVAPLIVLGLVRVLRPVTRRGGLRLLGLVVLTLLFLLVPYSGYLIVRAENPIWRVTQLRAGGNLLPPVALPWGVFQAPYPTGLPVPAFAVILAGAVVFAWRRPADRELRTAWAQGLFWAAAGILFSLPPVVNWGGERVVLPHARLASWLPIYTVLRFPARLAIAGQMALALLTGVGFATCVQALTLGPRGRRIVSFVGAALVACVTHAAYLQTDPMPHVPPHGPLPASYPVRPAIRGDSFLVRILGLAGGPVVELPVAGGPITHAEAMYRSIFHRRPLLNGYSGYWPTRFPARVALACRLPDPEALAALRRETGLDTIVVHGKVMGARSVRGPYSCPPAPGENVLTRAYEWGSLAQHGRTDIWLIARDGSDLVFQVAAR